MAMFDEIAITVLAFPQYRFHFSMRANVPGRANQSDNFTRCILGCKSVDVHPFRSAAWTNNSKFPVQAICAFQLGEYLQDPARVMRMNKRPIRCGIGVKCADRTLTDVLKCRAH